MRIFKDKTVHGIKKLMVMEADTCPEGWRTTKVPEVFTKVEAPKETIFSKPKRGRKKVK